MLTGSLLLNPSQALWMFPGLGGEWGEGGELKDPKPKP